MKVFAFLCAFAAARNGVIAVKFAILITPLCFSVGMAIDYTRAADVRDKLQAASDAAAVAALAPSVPSAEKQTIANEIFLATLDPDTLAMLVADPTISLTTTERDATGRIQITVRYQAEIKTAFGTLLGIETMNAGGQAVARTGVKQYIDLHVLMDTSDSMGLAAGEDGRLALRQATAAVKIAERNGKKEGESKSNLLYGDGEDASKYSAYFVAKDSTGKGFVGCEFACHSASNGVAKSTLDIARESDVELRIDVAREGVMEVARLAEAAKANDSYIRMGLSAFSTTLRNLLPVTSDLREFSASVSKTTTFDIGTAAVPTTEEKTEIGAFYPLGWNSCWAGKSNTFFDYIAPKYASWLTTYRSTAASADTEDRIPEQVVILVTDGLKSQNCAASRSKQEVYPFRLTDCEQIKSTGARLAIIYTTYAAEPLATYNSHAKHAVESTQNFIYDSSTKSSGVLENLKACASTGLFATGDSAEEIQDAFQQIFNNIKVTTYISN